MSYDIYSGLLKAFALPREVNSDIRFAFDNSHPNYSLLKSKYPIEAIAGNAGDFSKAVNLLHWVSGHMYHNGNYVGVMEQNALHLLDYAYDKGSSCGVNCVALATVLSECLLAIGLKARVVFMMPCSPYDGDNHVVTHVFIREIKKWVMFDPTLNAYITNEQNEYLSLLELRNHLADQQPIFFNKEAKYNDDLWTEESTRENTEYLAKNLFYFQMAEISSFGPSSRPSNRIVTLSPLGYDPKEIRLSNIAYRVRKYGDNPLVREWSENAKEEEYFFCSSDDFEEPLVQ